MPNSIDMLEDSSNFIGYLVRSSTTVANYFTLLSPTTTTTATTTTTTTTLTLVSPPAIIFICPIAKIDNFSYFLCFI